MDIATARKERKRLSRELLKANKHWSKGILAYRLLFMFAPIALSKRLAGHFKNIQVFPGLDIPGMPDPEPGEVTIPTQPPAADVPGVPGDGETPEQPPAGDGPGYIIVDPPPLPDLPPELIDDAGNLMYIPFSGINIWGPGPPNRPPSSPPSPGGEVPTIFWSDDSDGRVSGWASSWIAARNKADGNELLDSVESDSDCFGTSLPAPGRRFDRGFFAFDLSAIPGTSIISAAKICITFSNATNSTVSFQEGTFDTPLTLAAYSGFTGNAFCYGDVIDPGEGEPGLVEFVFNAAGIAYLNSKKGETAKICGREYDHDFLDVEADDRYYYSGCYFRESATEENWPYIEVEY